jgi:hypothetical protein
VKISYSDSFKAIRPSRDKATFKLTANDRLAGNAMIQSGLTQQQARTALTTNSHPEARHVIDTSAEEYYQYAMRAERLDLRDQPLESEPEVWDSEDGRA